MWLVTWYKTCARDKECNERYDSKRDAMHRVRILYSLGMIAQVYKLYKGQ